MPERLRFAVIGVGAIGLDHLNSLLHCPRASAVAIAESHAGRAKEAADRYKIARSYLDYRELLEQPDIDAVTIALPNQLHAQVAIDALQARKHVFLEKPMATNAKDAAKIIETAKKMKRVVMVGQNLRFNRHTQAVRSFIERGDAGEIYHARCFWLRRSGIPRIGSWFTRKQEAGGGCTYDLGSHLLDLALHLLGDFDVASVSGQTYAKFGPRGLGDGHWGKSEIDPKRPFEVEDFSVAMLKLRKGRTITCEIGWAAFPPMNDREYGVDLFGTAAGLSLFPARMTRNGINGYELTELSLPKLNYPEDRLHHFAAAVLEGKRALVGVEESLQVQKVLDAIYASSASGKEVIIK